MKKMEIKEVATSVERLSKSQEALVKSQQETDYRLSRNEVNISNIDKRLDRITLLQEEFFEKADRQRQEDRKLQEAADRRQEKFFQEAAYWQKEADRRQEEFFKRQEQDTQNLKEEVTKTISEIHETNKKLYKHDSRWGQFMESLVEGDLIKLLQKRGIMVEDITKESKFKRAGKIYQFDVIAGNGEEVVIVEVKTTLDDGDVRHFLNKVKEFIPQHSEFKGKKIYGAVAYLREHAESTVYAQGQGLLVIRATGSSASIINPKNFKPRVLGK